jgi:hypothetical protein
MVSEVGRKKDPELQAVLEQISDDQELKKEISNTQDKRQEKMRKDMSAGQVELKSK